MPDFGWGADRGRRDFGGSQGPGDDSLDAIAHSDQLLDALAGQYRVPPSDAGEAELLALLEGWRDGVRRPAATNLISEYDAAAAVQRGRAQRPVASNGTRRHLAVVGSVAAAVLCIGGFGAVVAGAGPGDSLYGMRTALFGEPESVRGDQVALAAQTEMAEVRRLIDQGDWEQAQQKLETVTTAVADVGDVSRKQELVQEWHELNVKVESRDPAATLPPPAPGDPELTLPVPVSEATSSPAETTTGEITSPSTTPATTGDTSPSSAPQTSPSEGAPAPTSAPETSGPETSAPAATNPTSTTNPPSPSTSPTTTRPTTTTSPPTTTTTPATTPPTTTTTTTTTTTQAQAEAPTSAPAQVAPGSTVVEADTETVTTAQEVPPSSVPAGSVPPSSLPPSVVSPTTTTVPVGPLIQLPIPGLN
ncbi:anti-sigma-D factor RsdA [Mycolicibacterium mengxianglii]|uniref:anti-sigma-D factor RsdA n=1 Tax=Mycolicibacterium mengxianglii TaxID=2736649 RepID=UPI0018D182DE|nr:anti-sigma-D factor RsdA [Mycolicibacterium mengxianglii]